MAPHIWRSADGIDWDTVTSCGAIWSYTGPIDTPMTANITIPSTSSRPV